MAVPPELAEPPARIPPTENALLGLEELDLSRIDADEKGLVSATARCHYPPGYADTGRLLFELGRIRLNKGLEENARRSAWKKPLSIHSPSG